MFNRTRQFNIISGQTNQYLSRRSQSCAEELFRFQQKQEKPKPMHRLGHPKDQKQFQYSYLDAKQVQNKSSALLMESGRSLTDDHSHVKFNPSMVNYVSTKYNIINHGKQVPTAQYCEKDIFNQKILLANRKNPLTEIIHKARLAAPNYHQDYSNREKNHQFVKKRGGLCDYICDMQKNYGNSKYFRKYK